MKIRPPEETLELAAVLRQLKEPLATELIRAHITADATRAYSLGTTTVDYAELYPEHTAIATEAFEQSRNSLAHEIAWTASTTLPQRGAFGTVIKAIDSKGRPIAIKIFHNNALDYQGKIAEASRLLQLQDSCGTHKGIVQIYHVTADKSGNPVIVMEFIEGPSLNRALKRYSYHPEHAAQLVMALANSLAFVHQRLAHRDIKPDNILLRPNGEPVLVDFGLAARPRSRAEPAGTPLYMAPETIHHFQHILIIDGDTGDPLPPSQIDARSDIWSLGVIFFELLANQHPFFRPTMTRQELFKAIAMDVTPSLTQLNSALSQYPSLVNVCCKCLAKDPGARFGSAAELAAAISDAIATDCPAGPTRSFLDLGRRTLGTDNFAEHQSCFGRADMHAEFNQFLAHTDRGILVLLGAAGTGKSALMAEWHRQAGSIPNCSTFAYSFNQTTGRVNPDNLLRSIIPIFAPDAELNNYGEELRSQLHSAISAYNSQDRLIVFIDGLDEAKLGNFGVTAAQCIPTKLPSGVYFVVSSRFISRQHTMSWKPQAIIDLNSKQSQQSSELAVKAFVDAQDFPDDVTRSLKDDITKASGNNFLVASLLCRSVRTDPRARNITVLSTKLCSANDEDSIAITLEHLWSNAKEGLSLHEVELLRELTSLFAAARSRLTAEMIRQIDPRIGPERWTWATERLAPLLTVSPNPRDGVGFFHGALKEYFSDAYLDLTSHVKLGRACVNWLSTETSNSDLRNYSAAHGLTHLTEAKDLEGIQSLLCRCYDFWHTVSLLDSASNTLTQLRHASALFPKGHSAYRAIRHLVACWASIGQYVCTYPDRTFQEMWNTCWWTDSPETIKHLEDPESFNAITQRNDLRLHALLEQWHDRWRALNPHDKWLRALRPHRSFGLDASADWSHRLGSLAYSLSSDNETDLVGVTLFNGHGYIIDMATSTRVAEFETLQYDDGCVAIGFVDEPVVASALSSSREIRLFFPLSGREAALETPSEVIEMGFSHGPAHLYVYTTTEIICLDSTFAIKWRYEHQRDAVPFKITGDAVGRRCVIHYKAALEVVTHSESTFTSWKLDCPSNAYGCISEDGSRLVTVTDHELATWDCDNNYSKTRISDGQEVVAGICCSADASVVCDYSVWLGRCWQQRQRGHYELVHRFEHNAFKSVIHGNSHVITSECDFVLRRRRVEASDSAGYGLHLATNDGPRGNVCALAYSIEGDLLATANLGKSLQTWNSDYTLRWMKLTEYVPTSLCVSSARGLVVCGFEGGFCEVRSHCDGDIQTTFRVTTSDIISIVFSTNVESLLITTAAGICYETTFSGQKIWAGKVADGKVHLFHAGERRYIALDEAKRTHLLVYANPGLVRDSIEHFAESLSSDDALNAAIGAAAAAANRPSAFVHGKDVRVCFALKGHFELHVPQVALLGNLLYCQHPNDWIWVVPGVTTSFRVFKLETN